MARVQVKVDFARHECLLDSTSHSPGDERHMLSLLSFSLFENDEHKAELFTEIEQWVGSDYESEVVAVGLPKHVLLLRDPRALSDERHYTGASYKGAFNMDEFKRHALPLFRRAIRHLRYRGEIPRLGRASDTRFFMEGVICFEAETVPRSA